MSTKTLCQVLFVVAACWVMTSAAAAQSTFGSYPPGSYNPNYPQGDDPNPWPIALLFSSPTSIQVLSQPATTMLRSAATNSSSIWNAKLCAQDTVSFTALPGGSPTKFQLRNDSNANNGTTGGRMKVVFYTSAGPEPSLCLDPFGGITQPRSLTSFVKVEIEECHTGPPTCCTGP